VQERITAAAQRLRDGDTLQADDLAMFSFEDDTFGTATLGLVWDTFSLDRVTAHLDCNDRHHQPYGIVHGGVWCAVVESLASFGAALHAAATGSVVVGVSNATDFLRAHREGRVDAVAEPIHTGRSQQLWQVVLTRTSDGKPVARGQVRLQQLPADRSLAGQVARQRTG
jgi:1,4-dihydroxy-2-naphthoyl-CoA hydrolase